MFTIVFLGIRVILVIILVLLLVFIYSGNASALIFEIKGLPNVMETLLALFRFVWKVGSNRHRMLEGVSRQVRKLAGV